MESRIPSFFSSACLPGFCLHLALLPPGVISFCWAPPLSVAPRPQPSSNSFLTNTSAAALSDSGVEISWPSIYIFGHGIFGREAICLCSSPLSDVSQLKSSSAVSLRCDLERGVAKQGSGQSCSRRESAAAWI